MKRRYLAGIAAIGATALVVAGCGSGGGSSSSAAKSSSGLMVTAQKSSSLGTIVTDGSGRTLYLFAKDTGPKSTCFGACASNWPPLTAKSKPTVGGGVPASAVKLVSRGGGSKQVTLNGHPLYYYAGDQSAGQTNGQGLNFFGAKWFALTPSGTQASGSAGSSSTGGGGYGGY